MKQYLLKPFTLVYGNTREWSLFPRLVVNTLYGIFLLFVVAYIAMRIIYSNIADTYLENHPESGLVISAQKFDGSTVDNQIYNECGFKQEMRSVIRYGCDRVDNRHILLRIPQRIYGYELNTWHDLFLEMELSRRLDDRFTRKELMSEYLRRQK